MIEWLITRWMPWTLIVLLVPLTGCRLLPWQSRVPTETAPVLFGGPPTLEEIVNVVNANSAPIRQLQSESASISLPGLPSLRSNLYMERPKNFRLRAQAFGPELDVGSNAELFWFWAKQDSQPAVYFARHDQFAQSRIRQQLPVDPLWIMEALGVVSIDPDSRLEGPFPAGPERVEIRAKVPSAEGELTKIYHIHSRFGWILDQHLVGSQGQLLASAQASRHRFYPIERVSLPTQVQLTIPAAQLRFTVQVSGYQINNTNGDPNLLWNLPTIPGHQAVNLGQEIPVAGPSTWHGPTVPYERSSQLPRPVAIRGFATR